MDPGKLIEINPNKMSGTPVFRGTRVPIQNLFDCIEEGETIDQFLEQFPTVTREQVNGVLALSKEDYSGPGLRCNSVDSRVPRDLIFDIE